MTDCSDSLSCTNKKKFSKKKGLCVMPNSAIHESYLSAALTLPLSHSQCSASRTLSMHMCVYLHRLLEQSLDKALKEP
jgi:hypothetical protein